MKGYSTCFVHLSSTFYIAWSSSRRCSSLYSVAAMVRARSLCMCERRIDMNPRLFWVFKACSVVWPSIYPFFIFRRRRSLQSSPKSLVSMYFSGSCLFGVYVLWNNYYHIQRSGYPTIRHETGEKERKGKDDHHISQWDRKSCRSHSTVHGLASS